MNWTPKEESALRILWGAGYSLTQCATAMGRTAYSIAFRLLRLCLITKEEYDTYKDNPHATRNTFR